MAGPINTGSHPKALWPGIYGWFGVVYDKHDKEYTDLADVHTSTKNWEELVQAVSFGLAPVKNENRSVTYVGQTQGYKKRFVHITYGIGYIISREAIEDNLYESLSRGRSAAVADSMNQTKETVVANTYNRAFNANYTGGDGSALIVSTHSTRSGNQSNVLSPAADISEAALEDLWIQISAAKDDMGMKIKLIPNTLHVHPFNYPEAIRILKSVQQNDTGNNATNALKNMNAFPGGIKMNHYFTDQDAFFIRNKIRYGVMFFQRRPIEFTKDNEFSTEAAMAKATERYSVGWVDWRDVYGSPGV